MVVELEEKVLHKVLDCEVKKLGEREYEFTASTTTQDRDGEVIEASGWDLKNFKKNPVITWAHDYRALPIGRAPRIWVSNETLKNTVEFPPEGTYEFADIVERLVDAGYLKTESVGFIPKKWEDGDGEKAPKRTFIKQELLEIAIVPVPSNPDALRTAVDNGVITTKEFENITKVEEEETVTKPEETDDFIRIPVRECDVTATIDISKKEGIKALYCGKEKKVRTYMFDKRDPFNWTMAKAKAWVKEHDSGKEVDGEGIGVKIEEKVAIPYKRTPLADKGTDWDAAREVREAEVDDLKIMCAIVEGDPENKTSYKLPHHKASGEHACVWRAVAAAAAALMGARGGVDAPPASIAGAKTHIGKHYQDFDKGEPPWEKGISQSEIRDELEYTKSLIVKEGMNEEVIEEAWNMVREIMGIRGSHIPLDICEKVGAVLNQKNRDRLEQIKALAQQVLDSAEHEPEKTQEPELSLEKIEGIISSTITSVIRKAQGKIN